MPPYFPLDIAHYLCFVQCLCAPELVFLPRYSDALEDDTPSELRCSCDEPRQSRNQRGTASAVADGARSFFQGVSHATTMPVADLTPSSRSSGESVEGPLPASRRPASVPSGRTPSSNSIHGRSMVREPALYSHSEQFERLISGAESEMGEAPPSYYTAVHTNSS
jgi:hypothetical protein